MPREDTGNADTFGGEPKGGNGRGNEEGDSQRIRRGNNEGQREREATRRGSVKVNEAMKFT